MSPGAVGVPLLVTRRGRSVFPVTADRGAGEWTHAATDHGETEARGTRPGETGGSAEHAGRRVHRRRPPLPPATVLGPRRAGAGRPCPGQRHPEPPRRP